MSRPPPQLPGVCSLELGRSCEPNWMEEKEGGGRGGTV